MSADRFRRAKCRPDFASNACAGLAPEDQEDLWEAATRLVAARSTAVRVAAWLSQRLMGAAGGLDRLGQKVFGHAWSVVESRVRAAVEEVLFKAHDLATIGLGAHGEKDSWMWMNRIGASASGAATGFAGLPGLLIDVSVTTALMLRSIAEIARDHGEDIGTEDGKRACLEVLAQGGPRIEGDEAELGYWSTRAGLNHMTITALTRTAAARLGVTLSEKALAQIVPVAGAVAGGSLNWIFMGYYQDMARVHFTLRRIERRSGDAEGIRVCFDRLVAQARAMRSKSGPTMDAKE